MSSVTFASELTEDYLDIAKNYYESNNVSKALEYVELVLSIEPDNVNATELKNKLIPTATIKENNDVQKVIENTQKSPEKVQIITTESLDTASVEYNSDYYNTKGLEFFDQKDYDNAIQYFEKAVNLNKNNFIAYNNLAMSYWVKGDLETAEKNSRPFVL